MPLPSAQQDLPPLPDVLELNNDLTQSFWREPALTWWEPSPAFLILFLHDTWLVKELVSNVCGILHPRGLDSDCMLEPAGVNRCITVHFRDLSKATVRLIKKFHVWPLTGACQRPASAWKERAYSLNQIRKMLAKPDEENDYFVPLIHLHLIVHISDDV